MLTVYQNHDDGDAPLETHKTVCPQCGKGLSIHQPDEELPDRLLATCDHCKSWFLVNGEGLIPVTLPQGD